VRRFETAPGKQAQADWGHLGTLEMAGQEQKLHGFTFTLGYSRRMVAEAALDQKLGFLCGLHGREPSGLNDLNARLREWIWSVANQRVHGTTHEQVLVRWDAEQFSLQSLAGQPPYPYVDGELRKVARDAYVDWQGSRYSVPWQYAGQACGCRKLREKWISARAASGSRCTAKRNGNTVC
jgi:hypothetical protein